MHSVGIKWHFFLLHPWMCVIWMLCVSVCVALDNDDLCKENKVWQIFFCRSIAFCTCTLLQTRCHGWVNDRQTEKGGERGREQSNNSHMKIGIWWPCVSNCCVLKSLIGIVNWSWVCSHRFYFVFVFHFVRIISKSIDDTSTTANKHLWNSNAISRCMKIIKIFFLKVFNIPKKKKKNQNEYQIPNQYSAQSNDTFNYFYWVWFTAHLSRNRF